MSGGQSGQGFRPSRSVIAFLLAAGMIGGLSTRAEAQVSDPPGAAPKPEASIDTASSGGVGDVVITARRHAENAQDVPISLTAITADKLSDNGVTNTLKLQQLVPSLQVLSTNARNTTLLVRGLGSNVALTNDGIEAGVGVYVDGVLLARPASSTFDLPDIASIEELRGPQGTLYGKNTIAGAINITTLAPSATPEAFGEVSVGDYAYKKFTASISGPLDRDGKIRGRLTAFDSDRNGFLTDRTTESHTHDFHDFGGRAQLAIDATDDLTLRMIADYSKQRQSCCIQLISGVVTTLANGQTLPRNFFQRSAAAGYTPLPFDPFARLTDANAEYHAKMEQGGLSVQADYQLKGFTVTSITAARFWNWDPSNDVDQTSLSVFTQARQANQERQFTQELRVASPHSDFIDYSGGLYYFGEEDDGVGLTSYGPDAPLWAVGASTPVTQAALNGFAVYSKSRPIINSYAAYGQATWHILPKLDFTGGVRYTYEYKTGGYSQIQAGPSLAGLSPADAATAQATRNAFGSANTYGISSTNNLWGGLATLSYKFTRDLSAYATYSRGSKSAGMNLVNLPPTAPKIVAPESIDNYEVGVKSTWFDRRLTVNADLFWEDDTNYQTTLLTTTGPLVTLAANIPGVRSRGVELDTRAEPIDGLQLSFSTAYTDATYQSYPNSPCPFERFVVTGAGALNANTVCDLSGRPLPAVSKWVISAGAQYEHAVGNLGFGNLVGYVGADTSYRSSFYSAANDSIYSRVPSYNITNARIGVRAANSRWDFSLWARNAFDTNYIQTSGPVTFNSGAISVLVGDPRTVGATLRARFD
jgi:iron complex outermembrane recepter protein